MYRPLRRMDINSFRCDLRPSSLFLDYANITADDYDDLIDAEVTHVLDLHAPLRTMKKRQDKHDCLLKLVLPSVNDDGWNDVTGRHFVRRTSGSTL